MEYSFLVRLKNHSVQSHVELSNKIGTNNIGGKGGYNVTDPFVFLENCNCLEKLKNPPILENLKLCVSHGCRFQSTSARVVLGSITKTPDPSLTEGNRPSYKSSITCNNNSKFTHHQGRFGPKRPNDKKL